MLTFMGGMLAQGTRLKVRRPALADANVRLYVFSFIAFVRSEFLGKEMGGVEGLRCATWYAWRGDATKCAC